MGARKILRQTLLVILPFSICLASLAQDLDPRAYMRLPIATTTVFSGFAFSHGGVVTDPTLPIDNIKAKVQALSFGVSRTFSFLGNTSQILVAIPYSWAQVSGDVGEQFTEITRSGMADTRLRFSTLLVGGKAGTLQEIAKAPKKTILGLGLNVVVPTGQFFPEKLINIGTNRWAFRPELALSQPLGKRWLVDVYSGVWFFTNNTSFFPGTSVRSQEPMGALQTHISYNINPILWVAFDATYYVGGRSSIDNSFKDDRQENSRLGFTAVIPTGKTTSLKFAASTGAVVRIGQDFTTYSVGWQKTWIRGLKK